MNTRVGAAVVAIIVGGMTWSCKSVPATAVATPPARAAVPLDTKVSWILRLEQQRTLRDPDVAALAADAPAVAPQRHAVARTPDLAALVNDTDASVRRRAALAIGRIGRADGVPLLSAALADEDDEVRGAAAFGLGLIGAPIGVEPLEGALKDASIVVRGRAVEGLGLIGQPSAANAIADAAGNCRASLATVDRDDVSPKTPEIELCRLALVALARLKVYEPLARVAIGGQGPVSMWWPVAYALQQVADKRAAPALLMLAGVDSVYTPAFALQGLAAIGDARAVPIARTIALRQSADVRLRIAAIRALGSVGGPAAVEPLLQLVRDKASPRNVALEAVTSLGAIGDPRAFAPLLDLFTAPWPSMRAAVLASTAKIDSEGFLVLSGLAPDPEWSVRAALATVLATLPPDRVRGFIVDLAGDADARVQSSALKALAKIGATDLTKRLFDALEAKDFAVRATAADLVGEKKPDGGVPRLVAAYARSDGDAGYTARVSALNALASYGGDDAKAALQGALDDKSWVVRVKAAEALRKLGVTDAVPATPALLRQPAGFFESAALLHPAFTPHAFIELHQGTIEIELNLVEAPVTSMAFMELARAGFFNGLKVHHLVPNFVMQAGDPRGDGEGGPGFTLMDELSPLPFERGTVGLALDGRDTGGSQFFIALAPEPQLEGKCTVFGRVVRGEEFLDGISQWDAIDRVRIWDGVNFQ